MTSEALGAVLREARAVLFDFDGPICSVFSGIPAASVARDLRQVLLEAGYPLSADVSHEDDPLEVLRYAASFGGEVVRRLEDALGAAEVRATQVAKPTRSGALSLRACVDSGRTSAIVTNNSPEAVSAYLARHGLADLVTLVVGRPYAEPQKMKPSPEPLRRALEGLHIEPASDAVLVGDSPSDIAAARAAGTGCIAYANRRGKQERLTNADAVIVDMRELATALKRDSVRSPATEVPR